VIGLTLVLSILAANAPLSNFPAENDCDLPSDREMARCMDEQYKAWDKALNTEYRAAMARLEPERRPILLKAQRIWVQYRDANCAISFAHGGTIADYLGEQCMLNLTRDRTKELHELHTDDTN
jgi:uncharacterized protein YecT (DUF1311 family)